MILLTPNNVNYIYKLRSHLTESTVTLNYTDSWFKLFNKVIMFGVGVEKYTTSIKIYLSAQCTNSNPPFRYRNCFYLPPAYSTTQYGASMFTERLLLICQTTRRHKPGHKTLLSWMDHDVSPRVPLHIIYSSSLFWQGSSSRLLDP
jgi:hypothetical protein